MGRRIERPPAHWSLLALLLGGLLLLLAAHGLSTAVTGRSATATTSALDPALRGSAAIWRVDGSRLVPSERPVGRRIALTFDDGPDPRWTPRIAAVLRRLGVPATFFVVGEHVVEHPDVVASLEDEGFELGDHTFNHADLTAAPGWERHLQVSMTDAAIVGAAGVRPRFFRPPYSGGPESITRTYAADLAATVDPGHLIVLSNYDSEDWRQPGVSQIVRNATPPGRRGGVVLFHDGGGDRSQTVTALKRLVPRLEQRGFRFASLSELAGAPRSEVQPPASASERVQGELLIGALAVAGWATDVMLVLLIPIAALAVLRALVVVAFARHHARRWRGRASRPFTPPVSVIVPAFNEAAGIEGAVRSLAGGDYPEHEVVVVDDGSVDGTGEIVEGLALPGVRVIRQPNAGKAAALSAGLAATSAEVIVTVDADTVFEEDTLRRLVEPFADPQVGAVAGNTKVGNRRNLLGRWQHIDYVIGFNLDRRLYDTLRCMPTVPGAVGAFRRGAVEAAGGFSSATLAEDTDLTIAIGRVGWRVVYVEDARGWTETPATLSGLWRQRYRWSYGTLQAVWKHRSALWRREPGKVGRRGLPYLLLFQIALPFLAPLIDAAALYGVVFLDPLPVLAYWLAFNLLQLLVGAYAFRLDGESLRPLWALPLQQFVYRQLMYLVVVQAVISAVRGVRLRWQHVERSGEIEVARTVS
ncbi:MAG TPA: bifunctional polysaccharide deacetylase/glycosyltransferase family 2 protein [Solirubrobacterales bacterium]|nr:bifunctional polysaccharide deacetylase/glycosyltransferase family 2 protein [Solirubrobacterales bacterium]